MECVCKAEKLRKDARRLLARGQVSESVAATMIDGARAIEHLIQKQGVTQ